MQPEQKLIEEAYLVANGVIFGKIASSNSDEEITLRVSPDAYVVADYPRVCGFDLVDMGFACHGNDIFPRLSVWRKPSHTIIDSTCRKFGTVVQDRVNIIRGISYRIFPNNTKELVAVLPPELLVSTTPVWEVNRDMIVLPLQRAAQESFADWLAAIRQLDEDLGVGHPYEFDEKLWRIEND